MSFVWAHVWILSSYPHKRLLLNVLLLQSISPQLSQGLTWSGHDSTSNLLPWASTSLRLLAAFMSSSRCFPLELSGEIDTPADLREIRMLQIRSALTLWFMGGNWKLGRCFSRPRHCLAQEVVGQKASKNTRIYYHFECGFFLIGSSLGSW